jgi:hypothetical protein
MFLPFYVQVTQEIGSVKLCKSFGYGLNLGFNREKGVVLTRLALAKPREELTRIYPAR